MSCIAVRPTRSRLLVRLKRNVSFLDFELLEIGLADFDELQVIANDLTVDLVGHAENRVVSFCSSLHGKAGIVRPTENFPRAKPPNSRARGRFRFVFGVRCGVPSVKSLCMRVFFNSVVV